MYLRPHNAVALHFENSNRFREALEILWELRKTEPEMLFALPLRENTFIIRKDYSSKFDNLKPTTQEVGSTADLSEDEVTELREKYFWPKNEED